MADAGPLIALGRAGHLETLRRLADRVFVPEPVVTECLADLGRPGAAAIQRALSERLLIRRITPASPPPGGALDILGEGEAAVITTGLRLHAPVLIDDKQARRIARSLGVGVIGTGGILTRAKLAGLIPAVEPVLARLKEQGYHISDPLVRQILARCGEKHGPRKREK